MLGSPDSLHTFRFHFLFIFLLLPSLYLVLFIKVYICQAFRCCSCLHYAAKFQLGCQIGIMKYYPNNIQMTSNNYNFLFNFRVFFFIHIFSPLTFVVKLFFCYKCFICRYSGSKPRTYFFLDMNKISKISSFHPDTMKK